MDAVASWALAAEIADVLARPRIRSLGVTEADAAETLVLLAPLLPDVDIDVEPRDPDDAPVIAAAITGAADAIVTGDADLLEGEEVRAWIERRGIAVLNPSALLARL